MEQLRHRAELLQRQREDLTTLKSPFGPASSGSDYVYRFYKQLNQPGAVNSRTEYDNPHIVIAYDEAGLENDEGPNLLFADGHVDFCNKEDYQAALAIEAASPKAQEAAKQGLASSPRKED